MSIFDEPVTIAIWNYDGNKSMSLLQTPVEPYPYLEYRPVQYTCTVAELLTALLKTLDVNIIPPVPKVEAKLELIRREP